MDRENPGTARTATSADPKSSSSPATVDPSPTSAPTASAPTSSSSIPQRLSLAEIRRRLPPGKFFTAEFVGEINIRVIGNLGVTELRKSPAEIRTRRRVRTQSRHEMASEILTGPKAGQPIYVAWSGVDVYVEAPGVLLLQMSDEPQPFLRISEISDTCDVPVYDAAPPPGA